MAMKTAMKPLLLGAALALLLCAGVAVADGNDDAAMDALSARLREVQSAGEGGLGELEKLNSHAPAAQDVDLAEAVPVEPDAAADLFAHIAEMQRKALEGIAEGGDKEEVEVEEEEEEEEEKQQVEEVGVEDPLAQERFKELEAALKGLTSKVVENPEKNGVHNVQLNAPGLKGDDVINLLQKYAQEMHLKLHGDGPKFYREDGQDGEVGHVHGGDHDDHEHEHAHGHGHREHGHRHEHDHDHGHHHHGHGDGDAHANVGFSRASDAQYYSHDHSGQSHGHDHGDSIKKKKFILPEEIAEEEDLLQYGFEGQLYSSAEQPSRWSGPELGVWLRAMGCSLLVSLASLICLMLLPCIVSNGKPSETVVNALAAFGAGAMLGDAFLHQLPHAFGNSGSSPHSHDAHHHDHGHSHSHSHDHDHSSAAGHGHSHSLKDLSIGLAVLGGILLFFIVEKVVRRYEELSSHGGQRALGHTHHHHQKKAKAEKLEGSEKTASVGEVSAIEDQGSKSLETSTSGIKKRKSGKKKDAAVGNEISSALVQPPKQVEASGGFVIGYLNLFSDAVHNFTDGMALGSAFLLHGTVGGWSRTLFLLAHELPQEDCARSYKQPSWNIVPSKAAGCCAGGHICKRGGGVGGGVLKCHRLFSLVSPPWPPVGCLKCEEFSRKGTTCTSNFQRRISASGITEELWFRRGCKPPHLRREEGCQVRQEGGKSASHRLNWCSFALFSYLYYHHSSSKISSEHWFEELSRLVKHLSIYQINLIIPEVENEGRPCNTMVVLIGVGEFCNEVESLELYTSSCEAQDLLYDLGWMLKDTTFDLH